MDTFLIYLLLFFIGSAIGSFTNVLIDRIPRGESFFISRSYCEKCKRHLAWYEMFPVFSYLILCGKCRTCHKKIPGRILLVEVLTGVLFVLAYTLPLYGIPTFPFIYVIFLIIPPLVAIFFIDLAEMIIPDSLLIFLIAVVFIMQIMSSPGRLGEYLVTGAVSCLFFFFLFAITRGRGMGFGDVKFAFLIGLLFGYRGTIISLYIAFLTGAAIGVILIVTGRKKLHGGVVPFGPFLILGMAGTLFFGNQIIQMVPLLH